MACQPRKTKTHDASVTVISEAAITVYFYATRTLSL